jgi:hypothetical protein
MAPMIFNRVRLPVVSMTLSTPVLIQPEVTFHFFDRTLPSIADSLNERINDNFQVLSSAS